MSGSRRWVVMALWPGRRRSSSAWISATASGIRGGQPSTTTPTAGPWDSPKVVMRNSVPKVFPGINQRPGRMSIMPLCTDSPESMNTRSTPASICR